MNLHEHERRYLIKILSYAKGGMEISKEEASKGIGFLSPRKATPKAKATRARKRTESAAEKRRNEVANESLRREIVLRAGGWCELRQEHPHEGCEPHHLLSGSAKKLDEKPENVMWVCRYHHDDYHRHPSRYIEPVKEWAARNGLPVPERILRLERRLASLPAARRSA